MSRTNHETAEIGTALVVLSQFADRFNTTLEAIRPARFATIQTRP